MLPSGDVQVEDSGRLYAINHLWVVAVALSPNVVLMVRERTERYVETRLLHELMGFFTACGCDLIPVDFRCPWVWRSGGTFNSVRDLWAANFFHEGERLLFDVPLPLSAKPRVIVPLASLAADATIFWRDATSVAGAIFADDQAPGHLLRPLLWRLASTWERRWNEALQQASPEVLADDEWRWLPKCDRAWADLVQIHLEPNGYILQPASLARLL